MELFFQLEMANMAFIATLVPKVKFRIQVEHMTKINSVKYLLLNLEAEF